MTDPTRRVVPPPVFFFGFLLAGWLLDTYVPLPVPFWSLTVRAAVAGPLFASAFVLGAWGIWTMKCHSTPIDPNSTATALVAGGPFAISRNPLYVALVLTLAGFAALLASVWLLLAVPLLFLAIDRLVVRREEVQLRELFGQDYEDYCRRVRRWV